jgi:hypothetical protein
MGSLHVLARTILWAVATTLAIFVVAVEVHRLL